MRYLLFRIHCGHNIYNVSIKNELLYWAKIDENGCLIPDWLLLVNPQYKMASFFLFATAQWRGGHSLHMTSFPTWHHEINISGLQHVFTWIRTSLMKIRNKLRYFNIFNVIKMLKLFNLSRSALSVVWNYRMTPKPMWIFMKNVLPVQTLLIYKVDHRYADGYIRF